MRHENLKEYISETAVRLQRNRWSMWQAWRVKMGIYDLDEET